MAETSYEALLERAYSTLPERKTSSERFEIPTAEVFIEGNKTIIKNFETICNAIRRETQDVAKYLFRELAVPGAVEGPRFVLQSKFSARTINEKIASFCQTRVICKECGKPDTNIKIIDGIQMLVCEACGARAPVLK
jgi:translation initiation factor 2 subunit 2